MLLKNYKFGFADASKELILEPLIIEEAFHDPKNILDKLTNSWKYIVIGRKGVGKSAYNSKLQSLSKDTENFITHAIPLNDFEYSTFAKTSSDHNISGTKKYIHSWDFFILLTIYKLLSSTNNMKNKNLFFKMENVLYNLGFSIKNDSKKYY